MSEAKKKHPVLKNLLIDLVCAGLALVVFALFHHVLPRQEQSMGIVIENPYKTTTPGSLALPEGSVFVASAGMSDVSSSAAKGKNNGRGGAPSGGGASGGTDVDPATLAFPLAEKAEINGLTNFPAGTESEVHPKVKEG